MNNRKCPNCRLVNWADAARCERCGHTLTDEHNVAHAYAPGDLGAQPGGASAPYASAEASGAEQPPPFPHEAAFAPYVAPFTDVGAAFNQAWGIYKNNF